MTQNVVIVRVGWMQWYRASATGEPNPIGGGDYNLTNPGFERDNFLVREDGRVYGYFAVGTGGQSINLHRIAGSRDSKTLSKISGVLVIVVALNPTLKETIGPMVVGWYSNATVYRDQQAGGDDEHLYRIEALSSDVTPVPIPQRNVFIPRARRERGTGAAQKVSGIGQSNIFYLREKDGSLRDLPWLKDLLRYVSSFRNIGKDGILAAEIETESNAGFQSNPLIRKAVEMRAMDVVRSFYKDFTLVDTSKHFPYDFAFHDGNEERFIEVKGSQMESPAIFLTRNEVMFARERSSSIDLCVVHSISVVTSPMLIAQGGLLVRYSPWNPDDHSLVALQYQCQLTSLRKCT